MTYVIHNFVLVLLQKGKYSAYLQIGFEILAIDFLSWERTLRLQYIFTENLAISISNLRGKKDVDRRKKFLGNLTSKMNVRNTQQHIKLI